MSPDDWVRHPDLLLREVSAERASLAWMPNFAFAHTARRVSERSLEGLDLSSLRVLVNGGEPVTVSAMDAFADRFVPYGLRVSTLAAGYGAAEATAAITQTPPGRSPRRLRLDRRALDLRGVAAPAAPDALAENVLDVVSCGPALSHTHVQAIDDHGDQVTEGTVGRLVVGGDAVVGGYDADTESSTASFGENRFLTGDVGFVHRGEVFVIGRQDDVIVAAGRKVLPHLLEELTSQVQGVRPGRVIAIGVPVADASTQKVVVLAEPTAHRLSAEQEADLVEAVAESILTSAGVVATVEFVPPGSLIKSSSGKPSRSRNRSRYLESLSTSGTGPQR
jgi:acyl-CoA synthetase (AMP-forming)/AMP-acid ligase II